jgi:hypothetical protein
MEKLLSSYLYEYKKCPLPSVGTLLLKPGHAQLLAGDKRILAPVPFIELSQQENSALSLIDFIAHQKKISPAEATEQLQQFTNSLLQLQANQELVLSTAGHFYMDENSQLHFKSVELPSFLFPEVTAERVIHPDVSHELLVGDTQTNSVAMTELLKEEPIRHSRWWIAAILLASLATILLFVYYSHHSFGNVGNAMQVQPKQESKTYNTADK